MDFAQITPAVEKIKAGDYVPGEFINEDFMKDAFAWIDKMFDTNKRKNVIEHNYRKAYDYLSHDATLPKLVKSIEHVYEQQTNKK